MGRRANYDALDELTPREHEVLELLRLGLSDAQIAERLEITRAGASFHVSQIIGKLGVRTRHEAASWPERPPWWLGGLAPLAPFAKRTLAAVPAKASSLALVAAGAATLAAVAGLTLVGVLLLRSGDAADASNRGAPAMFASYGLPSNDLFRWLNKKPYRATETPAKPPLSESGEAPPAGDGAGVPESPAVHPEATAKPPKPAATFEPKPTPLGIPSPDPTPHPNCAAFPPPSGWIFVTFRADVSIEQAQQVVASLGAQWSDYQEANLQPLELPIPDPSPDGYVRVVGVPVGEEGSYAAAFERQPEVVRAQLDWPLCDDFR